MQKRAQNFSKHSSAFLYIVSFFNRGRGGWRGFFIFFKIYHATVKNPSTFFLFTNFFSTPNSNIMFFFFFVVEINFLAHCAKHNASGRRAFGWMIWRRLFFSSSLFRSRFHSLRIVDFLL